MPPESRTQLIQENFEVVSQASPIKSPTSRRSQLVRDDRYEPAGVECHILIQSQTYEVINYSSFGVSIFSKNPIPLENPALVYATFTVDKTVINELGLRKVREEQLGEHYYKTAFEIQTEPLNILKIRSLTRTRQALEEQTAGVALLEQIPTLFRQRVFEIKDNLESLQERINLLESNQAFNSNYEIQTFEQTVTKEVADYLQKTFAQNYKEVFGMISTLDENTLKMSYEFFREKLKHLIYQTPFGERCLEKPLGYAGDYEMMSFLYRNENIGNSLFAKCLHRFYMEHANGKAVRNRADFLTSKLSDAISKKKDIKILSVASGPAFEISKLLDQKTDLSQCEIHLLDQDLTSLRTAQRDIKSKSRTLGKEIQVKYLHKAMKNVIAGRLEEKYDLIYCAGVFDYFSDPVALAAARSLFDRLQPGGKLIIGNFTARPDAKIFMELSLDWYLVYRTESDLNKLYATLGKVSVESESEGVNLFVILEK